MPLIFGRKRLCGVTVRKWLRCGFILLIALVFLLTSSLEGLIGHPMMRLNLPQHSFAAFVTTKTPARLAKPTSANLFSCFEGVTTEVRSSAGYAAVVVRLSSLIIGALRADVGLKTFVERALVGLVDGGFGHVILVPGSDSWSLDDVEDVRAAVVAAKDEHGMALLPRFTAIPPDVAQCVGGGDSAAGVAWAIATESEAVCVLDHVSPLQKRALFPDPGLPRFTPQPSDDSTSLSATLAQVLRAHFVACGGQPAPCSPTQASLHLCSLWLRPVVQYGLCHSVGEYSAGRHSTLAANSPADVDIFSGDRLLEEVASMTLRPGAVWQLTEHEARDRNTAQEGTSSRRQWPWPVNRLTHWTVAWALLDLETHDRAAQAVVEVMLSEVMGANITVLPPGRLCNMSSGDWSTPVTDTEVAQVSTDAVQAAVKSALALYRDYQSSSSKRTISLAIFSSVLGGAIDALTMSSANTSAVLSVNAAQTLRRWILIYTSAVKLRSTARQRRLEFTKSPQNDLAVPVPHGTVLSGSAADFMASPLLSSLNSSWTSTGGEAVAITGAVLPLSLRPMPREHANATDYIVQDAHRTYSHCYRDHHNVRDILLVLNFNAFEDPWGPNALRSLLQWYAPYFPAIIATHATHAVLNSSYAPSGSDCGGACNGIPALHLERCNQDSRTCQGCNGWQSQHCAARAMTRFSGHLGYIIAQDDALLAPWNWLANPPNRLWHKRKWPANTPPFTTRDWTYSCNEPRCHDCHSGDTRIGAAALGRMHDRLPPWVLDVKRASFNATDGVSCSIVDAYFVPGSLARAAAWFLETTARVPSQYNANVTEGVFVELATSTMFDSLALPSERVFLRNVHIGDNNGGLAALARTFGLRFSDWAHQVKLSSPSARAFAEAVFHNATVLRLMYEPDVRALLARAPFTQFW